MDNKQGKNRYSGGSRSTIQSLSRGLTLLEYVANASDRVALGDLADLLGIEKSSVHRLMATLVEHDYVVQDSGRKYLPGPAIQFLALKAGNRFQSHDVAGPFLAELTEQTGETAHFGVLYRNHVILTNCVSSGHALAVTNRLGEEEPLYCTALGKALVCDFDESKLKEAVGNSRLEKFTEKTIHTMDAFIEECHRVQRNLLACDDEEFRLGVKCLAAPVRDFSGNVVAAIGISGPADRLGPDRFEQVGRQVRQIGIEISARLGFVTQ